MKYDCVVTLKCVIDSEADSLCDMQWDIAKFIQTHVMDDEETSPITYLEFDIKTCKQLGPVSGREGGK